MKFIGATIQEGNPDIIRLEFIKGEENLVYFLAPDTLLKSILFYNETFVTPPKEDDKK